MSYPAIVIDPPIIAHRGASALAPENTMVCFKKAKECGINWLEFDVTVASCGEIVVFHDDTLLRTTGGAGNINDFSYVELQCLDAGSWFSPQFVGERIPTLKEVLLFLNHYKMAANIEIKPFVGHEAWLAKRVVEDIIKYANKTTPLLVTSFSKTILEQIRMLSPSLPLGYVMDDFNKNFLTICHELSLISVGINHLHLTAEQAKIIKASGRLLLAYTVNTVQCAKTLFSWGVDAVFSDCAQEMLLELKSF